MTNKLFKPRPSVYVRSSLSILYSLSNCTGFLLIISGSRSHMHLNPSREPCTVQLQDREPCIFDCLKTWPGKVFTLLRASISCITIQTYIIMLLNIRCISYSTCDARAAGTPNHVRLCEFRDVHRGLGHPYHRFE
jgi:hypothetical protein